MDPISSLDGFDPFLLPSVIAGMDPAYAENHWTVNGASEVVDSDSSKNSEQDDTDDFQSPNESQQIGDEVNMSEPSPRCWEHGCNGRVFSTHSNLIRHQAEKSQARPTCKCPQCGAVFSRTSARNQHVAKRSCNRIRRYSNGRKRRCPKVID